MKLPTVNRILVVDDEASLRFFLREELEEHGYELFTAANGQEALALLQKNPVDLAIIDLQMPGLNGLELMAAMQELEDTPELIMLTAHASLETSIQAMRRGSTDFLLKPYEIDQLLQSVQQAMARRRKKLQQQLAMRLLADSLGLGEEPAPDEIEPEETILPQPAVASPVLEPTCFTSRGLKLDLETMTTTKNEKPLSLTPTEFRLLTVFMKWPDHPYTFQELAEVVHGQEVDPFQARDLLKSHIGRLRRKLGNAPDGQPYIVNVRGVGYKLAQESG